jgi:hypothetical protein
VGSWSASKSRTISGNYQSGLTRKSTVTVMTTVHPRRRAERDRAKFVDEAPSLRKNQMPKAATNTPHYGGGGAEHRKK